MVRGDAESQGSSSNSPKEEAEIDRIIKEIEDLEKKMDSADTEPTSDAGASAEAESNTESSGESIEEPNESAKVYPIHSNASTQSDSESLAETDAVPASQEPLLQGGNADGGGSLAMKIGGCTEVSLEFSKAGLQVTLTCNDEVLCITTDQGAEFRVPLKKVA